MTTKRKPQLLAPAGDFTSLQAAIQSGCDAVYLGVEELNMRRAATNFLLSDLNEATKRCREAGKACYLTLNTIVFSSQLHEINRILDVAGNNVDAVICWDPAVIEGCRVRHIPVHISTQASVSNPVAARMYRELGAVRVIAARECTLNEIVQIKQKSGLEVEAFVHGAMCVSVSGRCYLSDVTCGKSGNLGECQQHCRREYRIIDLQGNGEFVLGNRYVMSAKDLCTLPFIEALCDAGIDSFKIEGRGRNPDYVRTVVSAYRQAIDEWATDMLSAQRKQELIEQVKSVYNRAFSNGFYFGRPISEFIDAYGGKATMRKEYVGSVSNYYRKANVVEIQVLDRTFGIGTLLSVQGAKTGVVNFTPSELRQNDVCVEEVSRGMVTIPLADRVRVGDKVYCLHPKSPRELWTRDSKQNNEIFERKSQIDDALG